MYSAVSASTIGGTVCKFGKQRGIKRHKKENQLAVAYFPQDQFFHICHSLQAKSNERSAVFHNQSSEGRKNPDKDASMCTDLLL